MYNIIMDINRLSTLFSKDKRRTFSVNLPENDLKKFREIYPSFLSRFCEFCVKKALRSTKFVENILFSDIDCGTGNFISREV